MQPATAERTSAKPILVRAVLVLAGVALLLMAIVRSSSQLWLGIWVVALVFVALPIVLFLLRDVVALFVRPRSERQAFWVLIHVSAVLAFLLGYGVYKLSVWSEHPMVEKHRWLPYVFVALVYFVPVSVLLRAWVTRRILALFRTAR
jgi:uncharacterized membrane protein SirB2